MSSAIVLPKDFKPTNVSVAPIKVMDSGAKQAYVNYEGHSLMMQVSGLEIPYGMSMYDKAGPIKYSVDLSLKGYDVEGSKAKQVFDAFNSLDTYMVELGVKFSKQWFKKELGSDIISEFYTPCVRYSLDAEGKPKPYPPTLKIQLKQRDGKFETAVYDEKKRPLSDIPLEDILVKRAVISTLIQCTGVWFAGSKFGLSWKAIQIKADHLPESIRGFAFRDEDGSEASSVPSKTVAQVVAPSAPAPAAATAPTSANHFSSLAEDEEEPDEQIDDEVVMASSKPAVAPPTMDDEADIVEPLLVPKKTTMTKVVKKVVSSTKK